MLLPDAAPHRLLKSNGANSFMRKESHSLYEKKTRLTSYSALWKVFSFVTCPERISISLLPVCLSKLKCYPLFHHPPPEVRKRKPSGEMEGLAAGQPPVRRTGMDAHIHEYIQLHLLQQAFSLHAAGPTGIYLPR